MVAAARVQTPWVLQLGTLCQQRLPLAEQEPQLEEQEVVREVVRLQREVERAVRLQREVVRAVREVERVERAVRVEQTLGALFVAERMGSDRLSLAAVFPGEGAFCS